MLSLSLDRDLLHLSLVVCYIYTYLYLFLAGIDHTRNTTKSEKSCFRCRKTNWHVEYNYSLQPPKYLIIIVNRFRYINNNFTKDRCSTLMDMTFALGLHKFSLQATIDYHGLFYVFWPLYHLYQLSQKKHSIVTTAKLRSLKWLYQKLINCLCSNVWIIDYVMVFGLEEEDGSFNYFHGTGTSSPSH